MTREGKGKVNYWTAAIEPASGTEAQFDTAWSILMGLLDPTLHHHGDRAMDRAMEARGAPVPAAPPGAGGQPDAAAVAAVSLAKNPARSLYLSLEGMFGTRRQVNLNTLLSEWDGLEHVKDSSNHSDYSI